MIGTKMKEGLEKKITFEDIQPNVMRKITNYMYTGCVNIPKELVLEVVQVCDELKIEDLKERFLYRVPDILSPQTAIGWKRYAHQHELLSIVDSCKRYASDSFLEVTKEKEFKRLSLDDLNTTLQLLNDTVSPDNLLASVLSWINNDKKSRKKALDCTLGYLELKACKKQFLSESAKEHIEIFRSNPKFNRTVNHMLHPRKLSLVAIGGFIMRSADNSRANMQGWKLESETKFEDITEIPHDLLCHAPMICLYGRNKLILTGGCHADTCVMFDVAAKKWKQMTNLKSIRHGHGSVCILQQIYIFGGEIRASQTWCTSVEYLNIKQENGEWQSAPPMPSALR